MIAPFSSTLGQDFTPDGKVMVFVLAIVGPRGTDMSNLGFIRVKGKALAVTDLDRVNRFYGKTLALPPDTIRNMESAYLIGDAIVMLKTQEECNTKPTEELNPRITVETNDTFTTEEALKERRVTVSDPATL